ncbi:hypothetical protein BUALT_Bualt18G0058300 [Buddleja alternifolia]|uniref:AAA+ ATPase domain-containing protein n=1 Tax=Buddleja alternifolia TaxID=168488 RepID=A0AAV6W3K1_9LAMI|nr:hypothetical protein BUALT_Bualt18G0058300 [Buddleja alternifolia]
MSSSQSLNHRDDEDIIICQAYMEVSQDPIPKIYTKYFKDHIAPAIKRLVHSIKHVELQNPSGASELTILERAKVFYGNSNSKKFKNGFKFDHVWHILKDFELFQDNAPASPRISRKHPSSQSDNQSPHCVTPDSTGFSQFDVDLNADDDNVGGSSSERPIGVKKAKLKKKQQEEMANTIENLRAQNAEVVALMRKATEDRERNFEMRAKEIYLKEQEVILRRQQIEMHKQDKKLAREHKILARDLSCITDETLSNGRGGVEGATASTIGDGGEIPQDATPAKAIKIMEGACKLVLENFKNNAYESELCDNEYVLLRAMAEHKELYRDIHLESQSWVARVERERNYAAFYLDAFLNNWDLILIHSGEKGFLGGHVAKVQFYASQIASLDRRLAEEGISEDLTDRFKESVKLVSEFLEDLYQRLIRYFLPLLTVKPCHVAELSSSNSTYLYVSPLPCLDGIFKIVAGPRGSFLLLGPPGVGKREIAKAIAEHWYCDERRLVEIDMSEYAEPLLGSASCDLSQWSKGRRQLLWRRLTDAVKVRSYSVIFLDKLDKVSSSVTEVLLDGLGNDAPSDCERNPVDFSNSIIFMTSSARKFFSADLLESVDRLFVVEKFRNWKAVARLLLRKIVSNFFGSKFVVHASDAALAALLLKASTESVGHGKALRKSLHELVIPHLFAAEGDESTVVCDDTLVGMRELSFRFQAYEKFVEDCTGQDYSELGKYLLAICDSILMFSPFCNQPIKGPYKKRASGNMAPDHLPTVEEKEKTINLCRRGSCSNVKLEENNCKGEVQRKLLIEAVKEKPGMVVTLDGVEYVDGVFYESLLKIFDYGTLYDDDGGEGLSVDFRKTIIILTFEAANLIRIAKIFNRRLVMQQRQNVKRFRTELLHWVDEIIFFDPVLPNRDIFRLSKRDPLFRKGPNSIRLPEFLFGVFDQKHTNDEVMDPVVKSHLSDFSLGLLPSNQNMAIPASRSLSNYQTYVKVNSPVIPRIPDLTDRSKEAVYVVSSLSGAPLTQTLGPSIPDYVIDEIFEILSGPIQMTMRPRGAFLPFGPLGVARREIAEAIAEHWSKSRRQHLWRRLTDAVTARSYSVILLDKIDKVSSSVTEVLLNVLGNDAPSDSEGNPVDFKIGFLSWRSFRNWNAVARLPGMYMVDNPDTGQGKYLISWRNPDDPSPVDFVYKIQNEGLAEMVILRGETKSSAIARVTMEQSDSDPEPISSLGCVFIEGLDPPDSVVSLLDEDLASFP